MNDKHLRRLHYRLKTQGMCELDTWLAPLAKALKHSDPALHQAIAQLLEQEVPELQAMMHGKKDIPSILQAWL